MKQPDHGQRQQHDQQEIEHSHTIQLEAEALRDLTDTVTTWVAETVEAPPVRLLDLGSGTGAGTFGLLRRFPAARATALDSSPQMLTRLEQLAADRGLSDQLTVVQADLDEALPAVEDVDLAWASSAMHHLKQADRLLTQVAALLPAGGWFVVVEADEAAWFLPEDLGIGRPGLEQRCHDLQADHRTTHGVDVGSDWGARLTSAGFVVQAAREIDFTVPAPAPTAVRRYAQALFQGLRRMAPGRLDADDMTVLDVLLDDTDPRGLAQRDDLTLHTTRKAWAAQRSKE